jgi:hypothetical protein
MTLEKNSVLGGNDGEGLRALLEGECDERLLKTREAPGESAAQTRRRDVGLVDLHLEFPAIETGQDKAGDGFTLRASSLDGDEDGLLAIDELPADDTRVFLEQPTLLQFVVGEFSDGFRGAGILGGPGMGRAFLGHLERTQGHRASRGGGRCYSRRGGRS